MLLMKSIEPVRSCAETPGLGGTGRSDYLLKVILFCIATYFCFYGLIPRAYSIGPALIFLIALASLRTLNLRWRRKPFHVGWVALFLFTYGVVQWVILLLHGEDISEFDLSFRYIAAALVLPFLLRFTISADFIFRTASIGAILTGCYAFYQAEIMNVHRVEAMDNAIHFGNGALVLALLCMCGLIGRLSVGGARFKAWMSTVGFVAAIYAALVSGTRGVWIAIPVVMLVLIILYWKRTPNTRKLIVSLVGLSVLATLTAWNFHKIEERVSLAMTQYVDYFESGKNGTSVGLRLDLWKAGFVAFQEQPLIGVGPAGVDRVVAGLIDEGQIHPTTGTFRHLHNQYVDILARQGLIGVVFYAALIGSILATFIALFRSTNITKEGHALAAAGVAITSQHLILNLTLSMLERSIGIMMFVFGVVFLVSSACSERKEPR